MFNNNQPGQVALIMVLIVTVVSGVAVSVASRTTVETRIQQMNVENKEAILTAQAGLEEAISKNENVTGVYGEGREYEVSISETGTGGITTEQVGSGESFEVNLSGASGVTGVKIYWRPAVAGTTPALFISDVQSDQNIDYAYDSEGSYGFTRVVSGGSLQGVNYDYVTPAPITIAADTRVLRITVLGASAFLGIEPVGGLFPPQSTEYRSVADLASGERTVRYGIEYKESKTNLLPSVFDYALFSGGSIVQ